MLRKKGLTRDDILGAQDLEIIKISVPEWGGDVYVKGMTGTERDAFEVHWAERGDSVSNIRAEIVSQSLCDSDGNRLFTSEDVGALGKKAAVALQQVFEIAKKLSGIFDEDIEELAEGLETNFSNSSASG